MSISASDCEQLYRAQINTWRNTLPAGEDGIRVTADLDMLEFYLEDTSWYRVFRGGLGWLFRMRFIAAALVEMAPQVRSVQRAWRN